MPFFYKNKNQTETQKILDKHKTGEINVYTFIFSTKKYPYKHLSAQRKHFGRISFFALFGRMRPNVCNAIAQT